MNIFDEHRLLTIAQGRQRELIAEAEQARLARLAGHHPAQPWQFYRLWLARLGGLMVAWGCRLRTRYEPVLPMLAGGESLPCRD